ARQERDVVGLAAVADLDHQAPRPTVDRRADRAVAHVQARALDRRLVGADGRGDRRGVGLDAVVLLLGDVVLLDQVLVALHVGVGVGQLRVVAGQRRRGLGERRLIGTRVDRNQLVAFADVLALAGV